LVHLLELLGAAIVELFELGLELFELSVGQIVASQLKRQGLLLGQGNQED
jgi:hypothetical protein